MRFLRKFLSGSPSGPVVVVGPSGSVTSILLKSARRQINIHKKSDREIEEGGGYRNGRGDTEESEKDSHLLFLLFNVFIYMLFRFLTIGFCRLSKGGK